MATDPRFSACVDGWANGADGLRLDAEAAGRRELERLVDLIGLTDPVIAGERARVAGVVERVGPCDAVSLCNVDDLDRALLSAGPRVERVLAEAELGAVAGVSRAARIERVLAETSGLPSGAVSRRGAGGSRGRGHWLRDLVATAAMLGGAAALLLTLSDSSVPRTGGDSSVVAGASLPVGLMDGGFGGVLSDADSAPGAATGSSVVYWWDVDPGAGTAIDVAPGSGDAPSSNSGL